MLHVTNMLLATLLSGFLSSMSIWADSWQDIRISLNDVYMILLMTSWMFLFMGIFELNILYLLFGAMGVLLSFYIIRQQIGITYQQYLQGMIPHHSMAVFTSRRILRRGAPPPVLQLAQRIVYSQEKEITEMKKMIST